MASKMPIMDWKHEPLVDSFKASKAIMELFLMDNEVTDKVKHNRGAYSFLTPPCIFEL